MDPACNHWLHHAAVRTSAALALAASAAAVAGSVVPTAATTAVAAGSAIPEATAAVAGSAANPFPTGPGWMVLIMGCTCGDHLKFAEMMEICMWFTSIDQLTKEA